MTTGDDTVDAHVAAAVARERTRLADALHDGALQDLMIAKQDLIEAMDGDRRSLDGLSGHLERVTATLRVVTSAMHEDSLDELGLTEALRRIVLPLNDRGQLDVSMHVDAAADVYNDTVIRDAARQLLANVAEHACATSAEVAVSVESGELTVRVTDDGVGCDASQAALARRDGHLGLPRIARLAYRLGGSFAIGRAEPHGTVAILRLPTSALHVSRLQAVLDQAPDAFVSMSRDGRVVEWNPQAERLFGWSRSEAIGATVAELIVPPGVRPAYEQGLARLVQSGRTKAPNRSIEVEALTKGGDLFPVEVTVAEVGNAEEATFNAFVRDIGARRAGERALQAAQRQFETAFAQAPIGMALVGLDGKWLKVNHALCQIVGRTEDDLLARTFQDITHPEDLDADLAHVAALLRGDTDRYQMDKRYLHSSGEVIWIKLSGTLVRDDSGAPLHFISQIEDVTRARESQRALARSEARLRAIFEHIPAGMALRGIDGRYELVNAYVAHRLALEPEEMLGRRAEDLFPELLPVVHAQDTQLLSSGEPLTEEMRVPLGDGTTGEFHVVRYPVREEDGTITGLGSFSVDITRRKRAERELDQQRRELADAQAIARVGSWSWEPISDDAEWSDELYRIFGRDPADGPATSAKLFAYVHAADRERISAGYAAAFGAAEAFELEYRIVAGTGEVRFLHALGRREPDGRYVGTVQDVSEVREAERSLRDAEQLLGLAFDHSPLGMTLSTPDRGVVRINQAFADMIGHSITELMTQQDPTRFTHPDDHALDREHIRALLDGDEGSERWEKRYIHAGGHSVWASVSVSLLRDAEGAPSHFVAQIEDISDRKQHEAEERALRAVAELVAAGAEPEIVFAAITEEIRVLLGASVAAVARFDHTTKTGVIVGGSADNSFELVGTTFELHEGTAAAQVFRTREPTRIEALDLPPSDPLTPTVERFALAAGVAAPILVADEVWGILGAAGPHPQVPDGAELRLARFAHLASLAITNLRTLASLAHRAATDPLTGIANRRTFHERLDSEVARACRYGRDLSVLLLDVDHFKAINDTHGHPVGDLVITELARRLAAEARGSELVARIGGDEFAWLLPESDHRGAASALERVRRAIEGTPFLGVGAVTLSAGIASTSTAGDAQHLMQAADRALYRAKARSRETTGDESR